MSSSSTPNLPLYAIPSFRAKDTTGALPREYSTGTLVASLQASFSRLMELDDILGTFVQALQSSGGQGVVFGGWVRDHAIAAIHQINIPPRDIDMVVSGISDSELQRMLPPEAVKNLFGGYAVKSSTTQFDVWQLENTFLIAKMGLPARYDVLPSTTVFRMNSVTFHPDPLWPSPHLLELGCLDAIGKRQLDFQSEHVPLPHVQVARACLYSVKLGFQMADEVIEFAQRYCASDEHYAQVMQSMDAYCPKPYLAQTKSLLLSLCPLD